MDNLLDRNNKHLFLNNPKLNNNSFIANINTLANNYSNIININEKFSSEDIELLTKLIKEEVDINISTIAEDLKKGSYNGFRKLDINLLKNFKDYSDSLTKEEKIALWSNPENQVYYDTATVYFTDDTSIEKTFSKLVNNHHKLYDELESWTELKEKYGETSINISPDTDIPDHELLRIYDSTYKGSKISKIVLHVAAQGQNQQYDSVFSGAKEYTPIYDWTETTSALITIAQRINEIINASNYVEEIGDKLVTEINLSVKKAEQSKNEANESAIQAEESANKAEVALNKQQTLTVKAVTLDVNQEPSVLYDNKSNIMTFGLPRSDVAIIGLSEFAINTANGHLSFNISNEQDVNRVYVDETTGNVIIEMKEE